MLPTSIGTAHTKLQAIETSTDINLLQGFDGAVEVKRYYPEVVPASLAIAFT